MILSQWGELGHSLRRMSLREREVMVLGVKDPPPAQEVEEARVPSLGREDPLEEGMATHSSILPGESHGQRSLAGYGPQGCKESDTTKATYHAVAYSLQGGQSRDWPKGEWGYPEGR